MKQKKIKSKVKMRFLADLSFDLNQDEVWDDLCSHNEKQYPDRPPIKLCILRSISELDSFLNKKGVLQIPLS